MRGGQADAAENARARALSQKSRPEKQPKHKIKTHQRLLQPIRDLAQIIPLHRAGQMGVWVVDPEEGGKDKSEALERREKGGGREGGTKEGGRREEEGSRREGGREGGKEGGGEGMETMCMTDGRPAAHTTRRPQTDKTKITHHRRKINHRIPLLPKPRQLPRLPDPPPPRERRKKVGAQHQAQDSGRTTAAERRSGAGMGCERRKNGVNGLPMACRGRGVYGRRRGRRKCVGSARSTHRAEAGSTAQRSQMLTFSTLGIEDLGPWMKDGLGHAGEDRAMAEGEWENWSCCQCRRERTARPGGARSDLLWVLRADGSEFANTHTLAWWWMAEPARYYLHTCGSMQLCGFELSGG
ncbi:hypothetical protein B0H13DRAFT_2405378 [Mycena leptocephala]|nr:hypothetical protein B0H13DRAFT_2405378 [Mycena leptocephala]